MVMPPPTPSDNALSGVTDTVRMATFRSRSPSGPAIPTAPQYMPRACSSQSAISSCARIFGVPVTDAGGKVASRSAVLPTSSGRSAATVDTRCHTPGAPTTVSRSGTVTAPTRATRPRSLRTRSTIITFSATSLVDAARSAGSAEAGSVPLIGDDVTRGPRRSRKDSGLKLAMAPHSPASHADFPGAVAAAMSE